MTLRPMLSLAALLLATSPSWAINKCSVGGKTVYQDAPCAAGSKAETIKDYSGTGPNSGQSTSQPLRYRPQAVSTEEARQIAAGHIAIAKAGLKDPDSAKFTDVRVFRFESMDRVYEATCGYLNAKNSYGGYVGEKPFWVYDGIFTQTFDHYMPGLKGNWLAGKWQRECLSSGTIAP